MTNATSHDIQLKLVYPTAFVDLNKRNGFPSDHLTTHLNVQRMKHKHFRKMQSLAEDKQIHYVMRELTGLSDNDLDELDADDSAQLSKVIFEFMRAYADIAKQMMG